VRKFPKFAILLCVLGLTTAVEAAQRSLVSSGSSWRYVLGTKEASVPSDAWRRIAFDDSNWSMGPTPIGYGSVAEVGRIATPLPRSNVGGYLSVYLRHSLNVPDPALISQLRLALIVDDGAIVWINGVELGRINVTPGDLAFNATAIESGEGRRLDVMTNATSLLVAGENILAVHLFNSDSDSSDIAVTASLVGLIDDQAPILTIRNPPATATVRESVQIEVLFSEAVTNVDAADLLINGAPATTVTTVGPDHYLFRFPEPPAGVIHVDWSPNHGITDRAHVANPFVGRSWTYTFAPNAPPPDILISEFMASNRRTLRDEDGEASDWIEIRNLGSTAEGLSGWFLTDKAKKPTLWKFPPGVLLPPNDFMIVFASAKNRTGNPLHTNFKLNASGGYLALVRPDGRTVASEFAPKYPPQLQDISYGRNSDQPGIVGFSVEATPGAPNSAQGDGFASPVVFSRESGTFVDPFVIEMSAPPGSVIRYTTTTNLPTLASPVYAGPIRITATTVIRARVYAPGRLPGPPHTGHYIQLNTNAVNFTSDLPIAILDNFGGGPVPAKGEQYVCLMVFEPKANGRSSITNAPDLVTAGRFHRRGSSTLNSPKGSWAFDAWDEFSDHKDVPLLGMPPESDWVMYAPNEYDLALIHNPFAYQLSREIGRQAPRTRFVEVLLKKDRGQSSPVNLPNFSPSSDYYGIYVFMEKIKIGDGRVNIDKLQDGDAKAPAVTGGYLWKIDRPDSGERGFVGAGRTIRYVDPDERAMQSPAREGQRQYLKDYFGDFGLALKGPDFRDSERGYRKYIDMDSWIDHHILNVVMFNVDALHLSAYFHKPRNGRITMGPLWDMDRAMGSTDGRDFNPTKFGRISSDWSADFFKDAWWRRMFTDPDFWQAWIDRYQELREGPLRTEHIMEVVEGMFDELREAEPRERTRWRHYPRSGVQSTNGYTFDFGPREYDSELRFKRQWFSDRLSFIDTNLLSRPVFSHAGGEVPAGFVLKISAAPGSTIYYTLDGTDPRGPTNAVSASLAASAREYSGPIVIDANTRLVARAYNPRHNNLTGKSNPPISSHWSGPRKSVYNLTKPNRR
jgi:hypothetical protein